ncbi:MAG: nitrogenase component 1 [Elusimicrobiota bacterium]
MLKKQTDFSPRLTFPHNVGVVLAVNALPDVYLVLDGPGCSFYRAMQVHGRHDWTSTLLSCTGYHRFQYAGISANTIATDSAEMIGDVIRRTAALDACGALLVTALPMCTIAGTDYDRLLRAARSKKPGFVIKGTSLSGNWLDGYEAVLQTLASGMDLSGGRRRKNDVAIIGHFMDRGEGDQRGNLAELKRMCAALDLNPVAIWPSGVSYERLREVRRASTIISLPHGRRAAATLAKRLRAKLVDTELPFGLRGTQSWLRKVAAATGRKAAAEAFIENELDRITPRLEWAVPFAFLHKKIVFQGDPHLLDGLRGACEDLGMRLAAAYLSGRRPAGGQAAAGVHYEPHVSELRADWANRAADTDLFIGNTDALSMLKPDGAWMEFGFPSVWTHFLKDEPYLGCNGFIAFADRMNQALNGRKAVSHWTTGALEEAR